MNEILNIIKKSFNNRINLKEKRPDIYQLFLPVYHEDGDMIDLYIVRSDDNKYVSCDFGMTLMRLSYSYEIDTENKEKIF